MKYIFELSNQEVKAFYEAYPERYEIEGKSPRVLRRELPTHIEQYCKYAELPPHRAMKLLAYERYFRTYNRHPELKDEQIEYIGSYQGYEDFVKVYIPLTTNISANALREYNPEHLVNIAIANGVMALDCTFRIRHLGKMMHFFQGLPAS